MPLDRDHITAASRVMLPAYVITFAVVGINWCAAPISRLLASPSLRYANTIAPIRVWGALFAACAVLMALAMLRGHRDLYRFALLVCANAMTAYSVAAAIGTISHPVSYSAWVWPALVATACYATNRSLTRDHTG